MRFGTAGLNEVWAVGPSQPGCTKAQTNPWHLCHLWVTSEGEVVMTENGDADDHETIWSVTVTWYKDLSLAEIEDNQWTSWATIQEYYSVLLSIILVFCRAGRHHNECSSKNDSTQCNCLKFSVFQLELCIHNHRNDEDDDDSLVRTR